MFREKRTSQRRSAGMFPSAKAIHQELKSFTFGHLKLVLFVAVVAMFLIVNVSIQREMQSNYILIAACSDVNVMQFSIKSWLGIRGIKKIVIVNWGAQHYLTKIIEAQKYFQTTPIEHILLHTNSPFLISIAYNIAVDFVHPEDIILKVDCDTMVDLDFLSINTFHDLQNTFYTGNWRLANNENELHLNGIHVMTKRVFESVGGFNERIHGYGYDDSDLYKRLKGHGYRQESIDLNSVRHLSHDKSSRCTLQGHCNCSDFQIQYNKILLQNSKSEWDVVSARSAYRKLYRNHFELWNITPSMEEALSSSDLEYYARKAAKIVINEAMAIKGGILESIQTQYLIELANLASIMKEAGKKIIILHTMHGLGNRMRALASAMAAAVIHNMKILLIWPLDEHMQTGFHDLFVKPVVVHEVWDSLRIDYEQPKFGSLVKVVDYMDPSVKNSLLRFDHRSLFYIRSAYILHAKGISDSLINGQLRQLTPSLPVQRIVGRFGGIEGNILGIHIRASTDNETMPSAWLEYGSKDKQYIESFREVTRESVYLFERKAKEILANRPDFIVYLASDIDVSGQFCNVSYSSLSLRCKSRTAKCMQIALAELMILGKSKILLGSFWSSFSEIAGRLAGLQVIYPYNYHMTTPKYYDLMEDPV